MSKLASFLSANSIRQAVFAAQIGTSQATVSKLVNGDVRPSLELAVRIERATDGAVPVASWVPDIPPSPAEDAA